MTTPATHARTPGSAVRFRLPDIPEREPDEVTQFDQLFRTGLSHALAVHLGNPETTLVEADRWIVAAPGTFRELARYPDLLVAFGVDPAIYDANNGYVVSEQGKAPDFVLEVASASTADTDTGAKRVDYARLGILEYWRFDRTGEFHGTRLAGERLVDGRYEPMEIVDIGDGILQGHSAVLNLNLRWDDGQLAWYDPATGRHIATFDSERERADSEREARIQEREARIQEREARITAEAGREAAEARVRELEAELRRRDAGDPA